jgi:hypothetical protein
MHWAATIRTVFFAAALTFTLPVSADAKLDGIIEDHVMHRFDREARVVIRNSGARFVSSAWNRETRTLIAVGEMDRRGPAERYSVAFEKTTAARSRGLKTENVAELCRHPKVSLISRFLERYDVTIALVYGRKYPRVEPVVVEISHDDLRSCA